MAATSSHACSTRSISVTLIARVRPDRLERAARRRHGRLETERQRMRGNPKPGRDLTPDGRPAIKKDKGPLAYRLPKDDGCGQTRV